MKTLAQLKRDIKPGTKLKTLLNPFHPERTGTVREVISINSRWITLETDGKKTFTETPKASLLEYNGNTFAIYEPAERELTKDEKKYIDNMPSKRPENQEQLKTDLLTDSNIIFYRDKHYIEQSDFPYLQGYKTIKGKRLTSNKKIKDEAIKGKKILEYQIIN